MKLICGGRIACYYDKVDEARKPGIIAGRRVVREFDMETGAKRTFHQSIDHLCRTRQVRIMHNGQKVHFLYNELGRIIRRW